MLNKVMLIGYLGAEPELRTTDNGQTIVNVRLATSEYGKDKKQYTEWHRVVAFGKLAEIMHQYLHKGSKAYFEGRIQTKKWQDKSGQDRYSTEILANSMKMLDSKTVSTETVDEPETEEVMPF